jgi:hypothetical protein
MIAPVNNSSNKNFKMYHDDVIVTLDHHNHVDQHQSFHHAYLNKDPHDYSNQTTFDILSEAKNMLLNEPGVTQNSFSTMPALETTDSGPIASSFGYSDVSYQYLRDSYTKPNIHELSPVSCKLNLN